MIALIVLVSIPVYCSTVNKKVVEKESAGYFKDSDDLTKITERNKFDSKPICWKIRSN